jgi:AbrB family looped-hinge helix DNA binding protein
MSTSTVTSKGQITIPRDVRKALGIESGDKVRFNVDDEGRVFFVPVTVDVTSLKGIIPKPDKAVSVEDMRATIIKRGAGA